MRMSREIAQVREFNRFYTRQIGVLQEGLLGSPFSLTEVRLMYELAHRKTPTASELADVLGINRGYLSRILRRFQSRGLIQKRRSARDGRQLFLHLTSNGQRAYTPLNARAESEVHELLQGLSKSKMRRLLDSMHTIRSLLDSKPAGTRTYVLRPPQPGDYGWVVSAHGEIYAREYGWNQEIERLAAEIVSDFLRRYDPKYDRCWIAESEGSQAGCVFVVRESKTVAKLRLLLVTSSARGMGIGGRLISECIGFAKQAGYRKLTLYTQSMLHTARELYKRAGFELVRQQPHRSFGHELVGEYWELGL